jgi:hypothetical protein
MVATPLHTRFRVAMAALAFLGCFAQAQPTYKLDVKTHLKPLATLSLKGSRLTRTAIKDDPGFRLQYHFRRAGKSVATVEARSQSTLTIAQKEAGPYTVVLELFYPAYKGGTGQKGEYRAVSNVLHFRVEPGVLPKDPARVVPVELPAPVAGKPALVIQCGKGAGKNQDQVVSRSYGYQLLQGSFFDGWPKTAGTTHAWVDAKAIRFAVEVPPGTAGTLRLLLVDGDGRKRKQRITVGGKVRAEVDAFGEAGKKWELALTAVDTREGKVAVALDNLNPAATAVVSIIEFIPAPVGPAAGK